MRIIQTEEEGAEVARLLGDRRHCPAPRVTAQVTVSTRSVQQYVMNMAQARTPGAPRLPGDVRRGDGPPVDPARPRLAAVVGNPPHITARVANIEGDRQGGEGISGYFRELVTLIYDALLWPSR